MTRRAHLFRHALEVLTAVSLFTVAGVALPGHRLDAQVIPDTMRRDTMGRDTMRRDTMRRDTLPPDALRPVVLRDSLPDQFPIFAESGTVGFGGAVWVWNEEALLREGALTIGDLLRRIPSVQSLRAGGYGQPEAATAFGLTRGRVQVEIDGYVLDPLMASVYDLSQVELINLTGLRVERRLDLLRIKLTTAQPVLDRPYTRVEAATGQPDVNAFRALFLVPNVIVGPLGLSLDRLATEGIGGREPADLLTGWAKWSWTNGRRGLQLEFRRQGLEREPSSPWTSKSTRDDLILRARTSLMAGLTAELFGGRSSLTKDPDSSNAGVPDSLQIPPLERSHWQAGARAAFNRGFANAAATLRVRDADALPKQELDLTGGVDFAIVHVGGDFTHQSWKTGEAASSWDVRAQAGPVAGFGAFVEVADGDRGAPIYADSGGLSVRDDHAITSRAAFRAGAMVERWGIQAGGAYVTLDPGATAPFGLPFDSAAAASLVVKATGMEAWGRIGLFRNRFALDAAYNVWGTANGWTYLPTRNWRIAGELHMVPLPSGNLEIFARLESVRRGPMLVYGDATAPEPLPGDSADLRFVSLPANHVLNGYLQIRIMDVRGFIQWEDMLGKGRLDLPDRLIPGPRVFYGVKWQLFN